jgi:hypothetical protein
MIGVQNRLVEPMCARKFLSDEHDLNSLEPLLHGRRGAAETGGAGCLETLVGIT